MSIYRIFILSIVLIKILYLITILRLKFGVIEDKETIKNHNKTLLFVSEVMMYLLLLIVFSPMIHGEVRVGLVEKEIFFVLGIIGLLHTLHDGLIA